MRTKTLLFAGLIFTGAWVNAQTDTAFVFQGQLNSGGAAASGLFDLQFSLFDSAANGNLVAGPATNLATGVSNGLFAAQLDFGAEAFNGPERWLQIGVRVNGGAAFTILSPLERITAAPYSITAINLAVPLPATNLSGIIAPNNLPGGLITNGQSNVSLSGAFAGNGANLTALNAFTLSSGVVGLAQLPVGGPGGLVVNGASSVNLNGAFTGTLSGDGSGITALNAAALTGAAPPGALTSVSAASLTGSLPSGALSGAYPSALNLSNPGNTIAGAIAASSVNSASIGNSGNFTNGGSVYLANNAAPASLIVTNAARQSGVVIDNGGNISASGNLNVGGSLIGNLSGNAATATAAATATTATAAASFTGPLAGDVTGTQGATVVSRVGGQTAAGIASGVAAANGAATANTPGAIVSRDSLGNFAAGTITANLAGNATTATTATMAATAATANAATSFTGALSGDVVGAQNATAVSLVGGETAANVAKGASAANAATSANTQSTIVARDASGDFAAATITAERMIDSGGLSVAGAITGSAGITDDGPLTVINATVPTYLSITNGASTGGAGVVLDNAGNISASGNLNVAGTINGTFAGSIAEAANFTGNLAGEVTGAQGATVVASVGGQSASSVASGVTAANAATSANAPGAIVARDGSGGFAAGAIHSQNLTADGAMIVTNAADQRYVSLSDGNIVAAGGSISGNGGGLTGLLSAAGNPVADVYSVSTNFAFDTSSMPLQGDSGFATGVPTRISVEKIGTNNGWTVSTIANVTTFAAAQSGLYRVDYQAEVGNDGTDTIVTIGAQTNNVTIPGSAIATETASDVLTSLSKSFVFYFTIDGPAPTTSLSFEFTSGGGHGLLQQNSPAIGSLNCPSFSVTIQRLAP